MRLRIRGCGVSTLAVVCLLLLACVWSGSAAQERSLPANPQVGERFRDCAACPEMIVVPAGSFLMGSPPDEEGRYGDEGPQHAVTIAQPFAAGVYEVTFAEFDACLADADSGCVRWPSASGWGRGRRPVVDVNWADARSYAEWLSERTGERYRLLSEAEWEYAARAGTTTPFHTGATISTDDANYRRRDGTARGRTLPVGSFDANAFGLHDMHGNVWEWVQDCWHNGYAGAPKDGSAWELPVGADRECSVRVLRGGTWDEGPWLLRSAYRGRAQAEIRASQAGFRVARTLAR